MSASVSPELTQRLIEEFGPRIRILPKLTAETRDERPLLEILPPEHGPALVACLGGIPSEARARVEHDFRRKAMFYRGRGWVTTDNLLATAIGVWRGAPLARAARRLRSGIVGIYIVRDDAGRVKIGKSRDVRARLIGHAAKLAAPPPTGGGHMHGRLRLVRVVPCHERALGLLEVVLHSAYVESRNGRSEVFGPDLCGMPDPMTIKTERDARTLAIRVLASANGDSVVPLPLAPLALGRTARNRRRLAVIGATHPRTSGTR